VLKFEQAGSVARLRPVVEDGPGAGKPARVQLISGRGRLGAISYGARLDGGEVEHMDFAAGTLQQGRQMAQALRVLPPQAPGGKAPRPDPTHPPDPPGTPDARPRPPLDVQISQACRYFVRQSTHP